MKGDERGSILLFTLFSLLILTSLAYKILSPYRLLVGQTQAQMTQDRGLSYLISLENIIRKLLPRVDFNLYHQINRIPAGDPVEFLLPTPEGVVKASLYSKNNCLNITRSAHPTRQEDQHLAKLIKRLAQIVLQKSDDTGLLINALIPSTNIADFTLSDDHENALSSVMPKQISRETKADLAQLRPFLCRLSAPGQYIDINAIDKRTLPVIEAILPGDIEESAISRLYQQRGNRYWATVEEFVHALPHPEKIEPEVEEMLATSSQTFELIFTFQSEQLRFSSITRFVLHGQDMITSGRRLIMDDSL